jgi:F-type H+-transporting ATPase subunit gamma
LTRKAELHSLAAENEERMQAMSAAGSQITCDLNAMEAALRQVRQEAITVGIIELGTGAATAGTAR